MRELCSRRWGRDTGTQEFYPKFTAARSETGVSCCPLFPMRRCLSSCLLLSRLRISLLDGAVTEKGWSAPELIVQTCGHDRMCIIWKFSLSPFFFLSFFLSFILFFFYKPKKCRQNLLRWEITIQFKLGGNILCISAVRIKENSGNDAKLQTSKSLVLAFNHKKVYVLLSFLFLIKKLHLYDVLHFVAAWILSGRWFFS